MFRTLIETNIHFCCQKFDEQAQLSRYPRLFQVLLSRYECMIMQYIGNKTYSKFLNLIYPAAINPVTYYNRH